jgi:two-component system, OmpR family, sensor histidine kinase MtrB
MEGMSLRRASLIFATALAVTGVGVAASLIVLTTNLHRATYQIEPAIESIRIGEEIALGLVSFRDASQPHASAESEALLRQHLADAARHVGSTAEAETLSKLAQKIEAYIAAVHRAAESGASSARVQEETRPAFQAGFASAREFIQINVEQSEEVRRITARWDGLADLIGGSAILLLVTGVGGLAWWLQRMTVRPTLKLVGAIERFANGNRAARADEQGPEEFRTIARRFNDMAQAIERQRENQLAFLAGVAHDLRNPLSALKMATASISPAQPLPPEDRMRRLFGVVQRQIDRMDRMVYDFLDAARIESGSFDLRLEVCDVRDLARATVELFAPAAPAHQLVASVPDAPVPLRCDPVRIEQVLTNLVSNAIKYSPRGGPVRVTVTRTAGTLLLSVADGGVGMSPDEIAHVFEPFRRVGTAKESIPGSGLGLFVARRIVEAHGGRITVESAPGKGSTFSVQLRSDDPP